MNGFKIKDFFSKLISLSYPKYRFFTFLGILILFRTLPFYIIEKTHEFSICSKIFGKYCYSVGITRGVSCLLRGEFQRAIEFNPLSIVVLGIIILFIVYDFNKGFIKYKIQKKRMAKKKKESDKIKNEKSEALMRIPIGIVSGSIIYVWAWLIGVFFLINFFYKIFSGKRIDDLAKMSESWNTQQYYFFRYMTFSTNERPFPFKEIKKEINKIE